jgi:hypothetical protein
VVAELTQDIDQMAKDTATARQEREWAVEAALELQDERDAARRWAAAWKRVACAAWMNLSRYHGNTHDRLMARFFVRNADHRLRERRCTAKKAKDA